MQVRQIYNGLTLKSELHPDIGSYEWSVQGMISPEEYFEFVEIVERLLPQHPSHVSLFDQRLAMRFPETLHLHASLVMTPMLIQHGLKRIAIIPS